MKVTKTSRKKTNGNGGHTVLDEPKKNPYRFSKSIEENEEMVEEMQQQILELKRKIAEKKVYTCLSNRNHHSHDIYILIYANTYDFFNFFF